MDLPENVLDCVRLVREEEEEEDFRFEGVGEEDIAQG